MANHQQILPDQMLPEKRPSLIGVHWGIFILKEKIKRMRRLKEMDIVD